MRRLNKGTASRVGVGLGGGRVPPGPSPARRGRACAWVRPKAHAAAAGCGCSRTGPAGCQDGRQVVAWRAGGAKTKTASAFARCSRHEAADWRPNTGEKGGWGERQPSDAGHPQRAWSVARRMASYRRTLLLNLGRTGDVHRNPEVPEAVVVAGVRSSCHELVSSNDMASKALWPKCA